MADGHSIAAETYDRHDPRLGRNFFLDSRSLRFQAPVGDISALKSVRHTRYIPILDQGQVGSCVGNSVVGCLGTGSYWLDEVVQNRLSPSDAASLQRLSVDFYSEFTIWDPFPGSYPPEDTGTNGTAASKILMQKGLIAGFLNSYSLESALTSLARKPAIFGTKWFREMFFPDADGRVVPEGIMDGGHEIVLDELDVENRLVGFSNSWSTSWGVDGRGYLSWEHFERLLGDRGDFITFVPRIEPPPQPDPIPEPEPLPEPTTDPKATFERANRRYQRAVKAYLASQS